jgi:ADP-ribosylglycohydrolase
MGTSLYIIKWSKDTYDGLIKCIKIGGDIGTLSPIVCGILSGCFSYKSIPKSILEKVEGKELIIEKINKYFNN